LIVLLIFIIEEIINNITTNVCPMKINQFLFVLIAIKHKRIILIYFNKKDELAFFLPYIGYRINMTGYPASTYNLQQTIYV